jgi:hypothetical protein
MGRTSRVLSRVYHQEESAVSIAKRVQPHENYRPRNGVLRGTTRSLLMRRTLQTRKYIRLNLEPMTSVLLELYHLTMLPFRSSRDYRG